MIFQTIKQRLLASLLPAAADGDASGLADGVRADGTWADLGDRNPFEQDATATPTHLQRVLRLAQADRSEGGESGDAARRALDFWLANDFQAPNWRQNQLAVPRLVGSVAMLMDAGLSAGARGKVTEILARSRWQHWVPGTGWAEWTGIPLLRIAQNVVLRGCVCDSPELFEEAFARVFGAIRAVPDGEEGIQPDLIYQVPHAQHADGLDGLIYASECTRFVVLAHGTQWQAPAASMQLLTDFLLDGQQWLMRHGKVHSNFPAQSNGTAAATVGELAAAVGRLAQLGDTPRQAELSSLARRLAGQGETLSGHRHFWRAGFSVHQRPAYYASVRLPGSSAAPLHRAAEGATCVMRSGHEFDGISADAMGDGLPGTTFFRAGSAPKLGMLPPAQEGSMAGGISEGDYGLAAMRTEQSGLRTVKAWCYFDHSFVCLGAGITATGSGQPVFTSVNHCRSNGLVTAVTDLAKPRSLPVGGEHALPMIRRIAHDQITYHFTKPSRVVVQAGAASGADGEGTPVSPGQFALLLNHGLNPQDEGYGYIVLPLGDDAAAKAKIEEEVTQIEVLANTPMLQAVRHRGLKLLGAVFWQAGMVALPGGGRVAANQPCVLLCRESASAGKRLSIANLRNEATTVHIEYAGRCLCFELPGGADAHRGVSRSL